MRCDSYSKSGAVPATIRSEMFDMAGKNWMQNRQLCRFRCTERALASILGISELAKKLRCS